MKLYVSASKKNRVMASDTTPISDAQAESLIAQFEAYANDIKQYLSSDKDWKIGYYSVPETNSRTGAIRNISFAIEYKRLNPDNGVYYSMILLEFMYDLDAQYDMTVTTMCPILKIKHGTYLCGTNDEYPFDSTNIEGLQTIHISPMMEKIDGMVYDGLDLRNWFLG